LYLFVLKYINYDIILILYGGNIVKIFLEKEKSFIEIDTDDLKQIGEGREGKVYRYQDLALKIHNSLGKKFVLNLEKVNKFKNIDTKRILLPKNPIYVKSKLISKLNFTGYSTSLVTNIKDKKELIDIDSNHLYNELQTLKSDTTILSKNKALINDLAHCRNFVFNSNLYFVDCGGYYFDETLNFNEVYTENIEEVGMSLYRNLFCLNSKLNIIRDELLKIKNINEEDIDQDILLSVLHVYERDYGNNFIYSNITDYLSYLIYILEKNESLTEYKYKILKEYICNSYNSSDHIKKLKKIIK